MANSKDTAAPKAPAVNFNNTELAFQAKTDAQLKKAFWLYRMIGNPFLNAVGPKMLLLGFKLHLPIKGMVKKTLFELFCGGETLTETDKTSRHLAQYGVLTILDFSKEGENSEKGYDSTAEEIIKLLQYAGKHDEVAFSACKLSGLADLDLLEKIQSGKKPLSPKEEQTFQKFRSRVDRICAAAAEHKTPIFIDAEETWTQDPMDKIAEEMMEKYNKDRVVVATTLQLYRWDRLKYMESLIQKSKEKGYQLAVKLVRGAYLEKERNRAQEKGYTDPMQPDKASTDRDFNAAMKLCIDNIEHVHLCAGTHNEDSSRYLTELMQEKGLPANHPNVLFSQLLGMSDHISFNLGHAGYNVAKYLPYGPVKDVMPYLLRRAEENSSVAGQSSRELQLLTQEVKRRKL